MSVFNLTERELHHELSDFVNVHNSNATKQKLENENASCPSKPTIQEFSFSDKNNEVVYEVMNPDIKPWRTNLTQQLKLEALKDDDNNFRKVSPEDINPAIVGSQTIDRNIPFHNPNVNDEHNLTGQYMIHRLGGACGATVEMTPNYALHLNQNIFTAPKIQDAVNDVQPTHKQFMTNSRNHWDMMEPFQENGSHHADYDFETMPLAYFPMEVSMPEGSYCDNNILYTDNYYNHDQQLPLFHSNYPGVEGVTLEPLYNWDHASNVHEIMSGLDPNYQRWTTPLPGLYEQSQNKWNHNERLDREGRDGILERPSWIWNDGKNGACSQQQKGKLPIVPVQFSHLSDMEKANYARRQAQLCANDIIGGGESGGDDLFSVELIANALERMKKRVKEFRANGFNQCIFGGIRFYELLLIILIFSLGVSCVLSKKQNGKTK